MESLLRPAFAALAAPISVVCIDDLRSRERTYVDIDDSSPALVQYTSGTSGKPKGVILTHANLLSNVEAIGCGLRVSESDVGCSWLPLFHDMGLIGHMLLPVAYGADNYLMRPEDFLRDPLSWLRSISDFSATVSTAPSSAYAHCIRHIADEDVRSLDLSGWKHALNGAEAIDGRVIRQFASKFRPAGFRLSSFLPVYGLAEAALAVTFPSIGRDPVSVWVNREDLTKGRVTKSFVSDETARELVSVGAAVLNCEYQLIADDGIRACEPDDVGEIFVRGGSVSVGYERSVEASDGPRLASEWISTGDLGVEIDNELYIVGRKKEVLIFFGANYYASDIESVVGALPAVPSRGVLATSVPTDHGEGDLLIFIETAEISRSDKEDIAAAVRLAVSSSVGLSPAYIEFVPKGRIERTSSGKLRRHGIESLVAEYLQRTGGQNGD
jgi:acyl-CoA synthetase (AMP-forming)/AMP-acid ligase II